MEITEGKMGNKKNKKINTTNAPKTNKSGAKKGKISKAREAIREEMRSIIAAAKEKNLIKETASKVRKARTFTTDDILSFISDLKVKTTQEVKKAGKTIKTIIKKPMPQPSTEPIKPKESNENQNTSMSYYERWYYLVQEKKRMQLADSDVEKMWHAFDKKATSYKYFWFLAILKIYKESGETRISYKDILLKMVSIAWGFVFMEKSEFPKIDQLPGYLETIDKKIEANKSTKGIVIDEILLDYYDKWDLYAVLSPLLKNVPYRFLSPWIPFKENDDVVAKSNDSNARCPYALHDDNITINPIWGNYFLENYNRLTQFVEKELRLYLKIN